MKKFISLVLCLLVLTATLPVSALAEELNTIYISSAEDLLSLAGKCTLDTWSVGKTVYLQCDIDLSETEFEPIPQFAGTFKGEGHTISGLSITGSVSTAGLFRKVLEGGTVENLTVTGTVAPSGSGSIVGGIAGENSGTILDCTFEGTVKGVRDVGGIAGINSGTGLIDGCVSYGEVTGEHRVGGIAGNNSGVITDCTNHVSVNNEYISGSTGSVISGILDLNLSTEEIVDITDIGGIAGFTSGVITNCINSGSVGYRNLGYNVGGIAGRQSGYISGCVNYGEVIGKKDAGGISGQIDPEAKWNFSGSAFDELQSAISELSRRVDAMIANAGSAINDIGTYTDGVLDSMSALGDAAEALTYDAESWANENIETINELSRRVQLVIEAMEPISEDLTDTFSSLHTAVGHLTDSLEHLSDAEDDLGDAMDNLEVALYELDIAADRGRIASSQISSAVEHIAASLGLGENTAEGIAELKAGLTELASAVKAMAEAISGNLGDYTPAEGELGTAEEIIEFLLKISESLPDLSGELEALADAAGRIASGIGSLSSGEFDVNEFKSGIEDFTAAAENIKKIMTRIREASTELREAFYHIQEASYDVELMTDDLVKTSEELENTFKELESMAEKVTSLFSELAEEPALKFALIDTQSVSQAQLFNSLDDVNSSVKALSAELTTGELLTDLASVSDAIDGVMTAIVNMLSDVSSVSSPDYTEDISASGVKEGTAGTLLLSENYGVVSASTNAGGIVGAITIDISFDLEDELDISSLLSDGAKYVVYAVVSGCTNSGEVTAEKSAAGGIAGRMDYGAVMDCVSGGTVTSKGSYAGGIAGYCDASVKNSMARVSISAESYAGGIVGLGGDISGCLAIPHIEEKCEYMGAIAGYSEGTLKENYYSECTYGAVDGFSYEGKAQELSYSELLEKSENADIFRFVTVTFVVDGEVFDTVNVPFGEKITEFPQVPETDGAYWRWEDSDLSSLSYNITVSGEYIERLTTISTGESVPLALCEGSFYGGQTLTLEELEPSEGAAWAYRITVSSYDKPITVRLRSEDDGRLLAYGTDTELEYTRDGSYIVFSAENGCEVELIPEARSNVRYIALGAGTAAVIIIAAVVLVRKKNKKKPENTEQTV